MPRKELILQDGELVEHPRYHSKVWVEAKRKVARSPGFQTHYTLFQKLLKRGENQDFIVDFLISIDEFIEDDDSHVGVKVNSNLVYHSLPEALMWLRYYQAKSSGRHIQVKRHDGKTVGYYNRCYWSRIPKRYRNMSPQKGMTILKRVVWTFACQAKHLPLIIKKKYETWI